MTDDYKRAYNKRYYAKNKEQMNEGYRKWYEENKPRRLAYNRKYTAALPSEVREARNAYMRKWHAESKAANPEKVAEKARRSRLKRNYGITLEDYNALLTAQGGKCALCDRTPEQERFGYLNVDHCHQTGKIRGLLCTPHNSAIAALGDGPDGLRRALVYVTGSI